MIQCSQRALPSLAQGENTITFSAGPDEGTVTVEGTTYENNKGKNVAVADFHPTLRNVQPQYFRVKGTPADVTIPIATPGEMTRLRFGGHYRARDKADQWTVEVSFDGGKTYRTVDNYSGPTQGKCKYITVSDIPAGTTEARVRWSGTQRNTTCLFLVAIDADFKQPHGGYRPVKITYVWEEGGIEKRDVHVAARPQETYKIVCQSKPAMKSIWLELAEYQAHRTKRHDHKIITTMQDLYGEDVGLEAAFHIACDMNVVTKNDLEIWQGIIQGDKTKPSKRQKTTKKKIDA